MRISRGISYLVLVLLATFTRALIAGAAVTPWWLTDWPHRFAVQAPRDARDSMLVQISAPDARDDGADLRVISENQEDVPWRLVHTTANKQFTLEIFLPPSSTDATSEQPPTFFIYFGNRHAEPRPQKYDPTSQRSAGSVVESRPVGPGQQLNSWEELQILIERVRREGDRRFIRQINPEAMGFNRTRPQLNSFRAHLLCKEAGEYLFSLDSTGASFLAINGQPILSNADNPRWGQFKVSEPIELPVGVHVLEVYHLSTMPNSPLSLGWATPTQPRPARPDERLQTIPAAALLTPFRGILTARETQGETINPFFTFSSRYTLQINKATALFVAVQFNDVSSATERIVSRQWNFGDGSTSTASNPLHIFAGTDRKVVTLTLTDRHGRQRSIQRVIELEPVNLTPANVAFDINFLPLVVSPQTKLSFPIEITNHRKRGDTELTLRWRPMLKDSLSLQPPRDTVFTISADSTINHEVQIGPVEKFSAIVLQLLFRNVIVAEHTIRFIRPASSLADVVPAGIKLGTADGDLVIFVTEPTNAVASQPVKGASRIVCVDDSLLGSGVVLDGGAPFPSVLQNLLNLGLSATDSSSAITVEHVPWLRAEPSHVAAAQQRLASLHHLPVRGGDLVILATGLPDILQQLSPDDFQLQLQFIVDYLRAVRGVQVLLVTPLPLAADPDAARAYARKIVQVGLEKGVPVCNLYNLALSRADWQSFFRNSEGSATLFQYASRRGQKWIAEELARVILQLKNESPSRS